jgi:hypothetical protein
MSWITKHKQILELIFVPHHGMSIYDAFSGFNEERSWLSLLSHNIIIDDTNPKTLEELIHIRRDWIEDWLDHFEICHRQMCGKDNDKCKDSFSGKCNISMFDYRKACLTYEEWDQILGLSKLFDASPEIKTLMKSYPYTSNGLISILSLVCSNKK